MKPHPITAVVLALFILPAMACQGCREKSAEAATLPPDTTPDGRKAEPADDRHAGLDVCNVKVMTLTEGSLTESVIAHGVTTAQHHIVYSAGMPGRIETMAFEPGDDVRRGAILARVDFRALKAQARQAAGNAELASLTFSRLSKLKEGDLITRQQFDEARSTLIGAQAQVDIAQSNLSGSIVKAEQNGIVTQKYADEGEYATPGMPLYEVVDYRGIIVEAQLAESQVATVRRDAAVDVEIDALNETFRGTVEAVLPMADPVSRTFTARVRVDNPGLKILVAWPPA